MVLGLTQPRKVGMFVLFPDVRQNPLWDTHFLPSGRRPLKQTNKQTHTSQNFLQVLGSVGALPDILIELEVSYYLLRRLLGVRIEGDKKAAKVQKLSKNEVLMVNIGSLSTGGRVIAVKADLAKIGLTTPVCTSVGEKIALSRRVEKHWRLIGWGQIRNGAKVTPTTA